MPKEAQGRTVQRRHHSKERQTRQGGIEHPIRPHLLPTWVFDRPRTESFRGEDEVVPVLGLGREAEFEQEGGDE